jgi:hypothetical protein
VRCRSAFFTATVITGGMTEPYNMNKPSRAFAKPLRDLVGKVVGETFTRQGFASAELVTRWAEIAGAEVAAHSEPIKIQWRRPAEGEEREPGTLVLRVEGPAAIEIQHLANVICDRVNRFLGWGAVARLALRQAPLRRGERKPVRIADPAAAARVAEGLSDIGDDELKAALARLGAAIKRP